MSSADAIRAFSSAFLKEAEASPSPSLAFASFSGAAGAFAATALALPAARRPCVTLVVAPGLPEMDVLTEDVGTIADAAGVRVLEFPPVLEDDPGAGAARLKVSAALGAWSIRPYPLVVTTTPSALEADVADAREVAAATVTLDAQEGARFSAVREALPAAGYVRVPSVSARGEFALRGDVLDVWSPDADAPVRAEFFGEELEGLRVFDPGLQTSTGKIARAVLAPVATGRNTRHCRLPQLLPVGSALLLLEHNAYPAFARALYESGTGAGAWARTVWTGDPAPAQVPTASFVTSPLPGFADGAFRSADVTAVEKVQKRLKLHVDDVRRCGGTVAEIDALSAGFEYVGDGAASALMVVTTAAGLRGARRRAGARVRAERAVASGERLLEAADLEPGELVVHVDHGVGRYLGSSEIEVGGHRSEVFSIEYADGAKLHVPVSHAHLLSRYVGVHGAQVKLHRLDGKRWSKEKADAQKAVQDLASSLLETQARRAMTPGFAYAVASPEIAAFEAAFPYEPTPDQAKAIAAVKKDMSSPKPMDRLLCGDAGYGKTEVAMRAAFIAAMNGKQTAVLVPTTVLAQQHYETFLARFDGTPVVIESISRFHTPAERDAVRARVASGATDIVIGTHALVSKRSAFRDLGLIVIDEEQRFGVRHKEHLKRLRSTAEVLTMSATPIPRTLYLSMTGSRDLSVIKTAPRERVATETSIVRDADEIVRAALEREFARGGQAFYLYNRVQTIARAERRLRALVPQARIDVAHGQMPAAELSEKMRRFAEGRTDLLLCTSIVESGLDIPRANTIVVDRADRFGIAELYQLRGRVGRSSRRGYAVFLVPESGLLTAESRERLDALRKHSGRGSGYSLSLRDLEIRGAGNLLGSAQSGHIAAVGFSLYCQLLKRTIAMLRGEAVDSVADVTVNLDFLDFSPGSGSPDDTAALPYDYVEDESQRMDFHTRISSAVTPADVSRLKAELADRYGRLPPQAERLVRLADFRVRCAAAGIARVDTRGSCAYFTLRADGRRRRIALPEDASSDAKLTVLFKALP